MYKIILPVAAFAVTATSASAFYQPDILEQIDVDLTASQIEVLEDAHELRQAGEYEAARTLVRESDLDRDTLRSIREAVREVRQATRAAIVDAIADEDFDTFVVVAEGTKLSDLVDTEAEFERLVEAWELKEAGEKDEARAIMNDLGIERPERSQHHRAYRAG